MASNHVVTHFLRTNAFVCGCLAGAYGRACSHVGAAIHAELARAIAERETGPGVAWRYWMHGSECE